MLLLETSRGPKSILHDFTFAVFALFVSVKVLTLLLAYTQLNSLGQKTKIHICSAVSI